LTVSGGFTNNDLSTFFIKFDFEEENLKISFVGSKKEKVEILLVSFK